MEINNCEQKSPEWWTIKVGKISGTRFGQAISTRANRLPYELVNEMLDGIIIDDEYINDAMQFGIDQEPIARELYSKASGIPFREIGIMYSDHSPIHIASPDGINPDNDIVLEIKCTQDGAIHLQRYFDGPESAYMSQIINYFAISDQIREVHWVSYCPNRPEKPMVVKIFYPSDFPVEIQKGRKAIQALEPTLKSMVDKFSF